MPPLNKMADLIHFTVDPSCSRHHRPQHHPPQKRYLFSLWGKKVLIALIESLPRGIKMWSTNKTS